MHFFVCIFQNRSLALTFGRQNDKFLTARHNGVPQKDNEVTKKLGDFLLN